MSASKFEGLPVWCCFPGSAAERAGVRAGDVLLFANGMREARNQDSSRLELIVQRGNRILELTLDLSAAGASEQNRAALTFS